MQELKRLPDWRARFEGFIDEIYYHPFDWKTQHDCGPGLCGRLVFEITGVDIAEQWRGRYKTMRGALHLMRKEGFEDIADGVATLLPEIHPSRARIGDIAAFRMESDFRSALGVVNGERVIVLHPDGIATMDLLAAHRAFKVG